MRMLPLILLFVCAFCSAAAQTNFVKNPSFEKYDTCPYKSGQIIFAKDWQNAIVPNFPKGIEYLNRCSVGNIYAGCPNNGAFYQYPKSGNGFVGIQLYYDKSIPPPPSPLPFNNRESLQGHLIKFLNSGKEYCVSFYVNSAEASGYAHNKIGAYLDDGSINTAADTAGEEITSVVPQVYTDSVIKDTMNWVKIEGSFTASGNETYITIGNFFTNATTTVLVTNYFHVFEQESYYLIDDVSVIPIDLAADAGKDTHAEPGKKAMIGRVGDTTAQGLDCKWYKKGVLIDSGAIISVDAGASVGAVDTYVVVQTICGLVKTDTVTVKTVPVGFREYGTELEFSVYPNPSNGAITITTPHAVIPTKEGSLHAKVYDLLGRVVYQRELSFINNQASVDLNIADGVYIFELTDSDGNSSRQRIEVRN